MPICIVCSQPSKYCCPKCKVHYCSLPHYKSHNLFCTEEFYQSQVESELQNLKSSPEERKKMRQILRNAQLNDQISDVAKERYEQLLEKIENGEQLNLTHAEEVRFAEWMKTWAVQEGESMFWEEEDGISEYYLTELSNSKDNHEDELKQDLESKNEQLIFYRREYKLIIDSLAPISSLCSSPHASLIYHIYALTFAGCIAYRYYDNQVSTNSTQFSNFVLKVCPLSSLPTFESISSTHYFLQSQQNSHMIRPWLVIAGGDTRKLWKNKYLVLEMLMRINQVVKNKKVNKKIDFYCSYVKDNEERVYKLQNQLQEYVLVREVEKQDKEHQQKYKNLIVL